MEKPIIKGLRQLREDKLAWHDCVDPFMRRRLTGDNFHMIAVLLDKAADCQPELFVAAVLQHNQLTQGSTVRQ